MIGLFIIWGMKKLHYGLLDIEMTCDGKQENGKFIDDGRMKRSQREIISVGCAIEVREHPDFFLFLIESTCVAIKKRNKFMTSNGKM